MVHFWASENDEKRSLIYTVATSAALEVAKLSSVCAAGARMFWAATTNERAAQMDVAIERDQSHSRLAPVCRETLAARGRLIIGDGGGGSCAIGALKPGAKVQLACACYLNWLLQFRIRRMSSECSRADRGAEGSTLKRRGLGAPIHNGALLYLSASKSNNSIGGLRGNAMILFNEWQPRK